MKTLKLAFWILFTLTLGIYAVMIFYSLPILKNYSNGLLPFDLRPMGYSLEEAKTLLNSLSFEGINYYLNFTTSFDTIFPALMAVSLMLAYWILSPKEWGIWRFILFSFAIFAMVFDYLENASIIKMFKLGADAITPSIVQTASNYSSIKAVFSAISLSILLALTIIWAYRKLTNNRKA